MGQDNVCSWDEGKRERNLATHGYDCADAAPLFDGRFIVTRQDRRFDCGEDRFNALTEFEGRVVKVTFTPRAGLVHLISLRPASREERQVYETRKRESED